MQHSGLKISIDFNLRKLSAVVEGFDEIEYLLDRGRFPKQGDSLLVKSFWLFHDVLFLRKVKKLALLWYFLILA